MGTELPNIFREHLGIHKMLDTLPVFGVHERADALGVDDAQWRRRTKNRPWSQV